MDGLEILIEGEIAVAALIPHFQDNVGFSDSPFC